MLDIMYDIPSRKSAKEVILNEEAVRRQEPPLILYEKEAEVGLARNAARRLTSSARGQIVRARRRAP